MQLNLFFMTSENACLNLLDASFRIDEDDRFGLDFKSDFVSPKNFIIIKNFVRASESTPA